VRPGADWAEEGEMPLPARLVQAIALATEPAWAGLLADGHVLLAYLNRA
jgi:hypothetical protein